ncbi:CopD family protein [Halomonas aquatica]|uniref:CopD family protein n=1 Tax=Halomonas aquatica TaxID=3151123 RepID=A0ABV1NC13_9GAMM
MSLALSLHLLAAVIWVGGMFFAWVILRPVAGDLLEPPQRLTLWYHVFKRFFPWVWASMAVLLTTGLWMIFGVFGGMGGAAAHVHLMLATGLSMMAIFLHIWFAPFPRLGRAVASEDWPMGGKQLAQIRRLIGINLIIGMITVLVASGGRYL